MQLMKFSILTVFFLLSGTSFADDFFCNELFEIEDPNSRLVPANQKPQSMIDQERKKADLRFIQEAFTKVSGSTFDFSAVIFEHQNNDLLLAEEEKIELTLDEIKKFLHGEIPKLHLTEFQYDIFSMEITYYFTGKLLGIKDNDLGIHPQSFDHYFHSIESEFNLNNPPDPQEISPKDYAEMLTQIVLKYLKQNEQIVLIDLF
ncbi:MAG: hypothetical protein CL678_04650 [Bdellovibrionaceae bacterium]|nr:hypothetical protein [Pseudobdellovibrionaceae bacterium]|tara:strand:+ start:4856 stop:5464 length:609 start_codon:yes stop_codon:yes gene_type:complete